MGRQMRPKRRFFWLHPPPTSLEAYSLLYLYLYSSVEKLNKQQQQQQQQQLLIELFAATSSQIFSLVSHSRKIFFSICPRIRSRQKIRTLY
jgi:hypothetical protein